MNDAFLTVLNMSVTGAMIIMLLIIVRPLLKGMPRRYSYALWLIPAILLLCPVSISSVLSVFNLFKPTVTESRMEYIPEAPLIYYIVPNPAPAAPSAPASAPIITETPAEAIHNPNSFAIKPIDVIALVWVVVAIGIVIWSIISYIQVARRVRGSENMGEYYLCKNILSPFVFGIIKPRIYLPVGLTDVDTRCILAHEKAHIKRRDYIVKLLTVPILALHWFNPLVWLGIKLMSTDMELSCDEHALLSLSPDFKKDYANALLNISMRQNGISFSGLLGFGESGIKARIKGVLKMKKPKLWATVLAFAVVIVAAVCLLTNAIGSAPDNNTDSTIDSEMGDMPPVTPAENDSPQSSKISLDEAEMMLFEHLAYDPNIGAFAYLEPRNPSEQEIEIKDRQGLRTETVYVFSSFFNDELTDMDGKWYNDYAISLDGKMVYWYDPANDWHVDYDDLEMYSPRTGEWMEGTPANIGGYYELEGRSSEHPIVLGEHGHPECDGTDIELMSIGQGRLNDAVKLYSVILGVAPTDSSKLIYDEYGNEIYALDEELGTYESIMRLSQTTFAPDIPAWLGYYSVNHPDELLFDGPSARVADDGSVIPITITSELERAMKVENGTTYKTVYGGYDSHRLQTQIVGVMNHTDTHIEYRLCTMVLDESQEALAVSEEIPQVFYEHTVMKLDLIDGRWLITQLRDDLGNEISYNGTFVSENGLGAYSVVPAVNSGDPPQVDPVVNERADYETILRFDHVAYSSIETARISMCITYTIMQTQKSLSSLSGSVIRAPTDTSSTLTATATRRLSPTASRVPTVHNPSAFTETGTV